MSSEYPSQRQVQAPQRRPLPGDSRNPNVLLPQKVRPEPAPTRTPLRRTHHEPRRRDERARPPRPPAMRYACLTPRSTRGPRSSTASARGRTRRRSHGQPSSRTAHAARMSTAAASTPRFRVLRRPLRRLGYDRLQQLHQGGRRALYTNKRFGICRREAEGDRVMARSRLDSKGPEESGLLHTGSTRGPKVYGWYSFVLKGLGVFP